MREQRAMCCDTTATRQFKPTITDLSQQDEKEKNENHAITKMQRGNNAVKLQVALEPCEPGVGTGRCGCEYRVMMQKK